MIQFDRLIRKVWNDEFLFDRVSYYARKGIISHYRITLSKR